jgi:peptidoglycan/LPS O-acetylase OafA/YrhL
VAGHIPTLDGVRGVAILLVFFYHALRELPAERWHEQLINRAVNTGWIGVDLFFVLSGFLITGILLDAKGGQRYFRSFYARRVLRIFPLYFAFVLLVVWIAPTLRLTPTADGLALRSEQWWYWSYMVNVMVARHDWGSAAWHTGHLWSLSVEEQFYLLWPALVFLLSRRALLRATLAIVVATALLRVALVMHHASSTAVYVLLPTRMDSLALGGLLAILAREPDVWARIRPWALPVGLAMVALLGAITYHEDLLRSQAALTQSVGYSALAVLGGATIVGAVSAPAGTLVATIWTNPVLRFFGRYSYGLYVWHHLAIPMLRQYVLPDNKLPMLGSSHVPGYALFAVLALAVSLAISLLSWHLLEQPFLRLKRYVPYC